VGWRPPPDGGTWHPHRFTDPFDSNEAFIDAAMTACADAWAEISTARSGRAGLYGPPVTETV
jgi:hypothetical protein